MKNKFMAVVILSKGTLYIKRPGSRTQIIAY